MTILPPLEPQQLHYPCDPGQFNFQTTADLEDLTEIIGQINLPNEFFERTFYARDDQMRHLKANFGMHGIDLIFASFDL